MYGLFLILLLYIELYVAFLAIYTVVKIIRKKKLSYFILLLNFCVVALFYYFRKKVFDHEWIFVGEYIDSSKDWGEGLANLMTTIINSGIVFLGFVITQIIFWKFFIKNSYRLSLVRKAHEVLETLGTPNPVD
jgi:hypothetical protein